MHPRSQWLAAAVGLVMALVVQCLASRTFAFNDLAFSLRDEDMRIIGQDGSDEVGSSLAVGDVDGDGIADVLIGAPRGKGPNNRRQKAGEVVLIFGAQDLSRELLLTNAPRTFYGATVEARLGYSVAVGDINGDGIGDIIMGAPEARTFGVGEGAVYVFYGGPNVAAQSVTDLGQTPPDLVVWGAEQNGRLGNAIAVGNFNDDEFDDIAIAAPREGDPDGRINGGHVYVLFGRPDISLGSEITARTSGLDAAFFMQIRGAVPRGIAGQALATGDVNGDGVADLVIGAPNQVGDIPDLPTRQGEVYVVFGGPVFTPRQELDLADPEQFDVRIIGPMAGDRFGLSVATANINGDHVHGDPNEHPLMDLLIGAPKSRYSGGNSARPEGIKTGQAYAIFGRSERDNNPFPKVIDLGDINTHADVLLAGLVGAELGRCVSGGDLDDDGYDEWIVGAPGAERRGVAYRVPGRNHDSWSRLGVPGSRTLGVRSGDRTGDVTAIGDVNGDGVTDLIVSSPKFDGLSGEHPEGGAVYVVLGVGAPDDPDEDCSDEDQDGFFLEGRTCGPEDCDDSDPARNPGAAEDCQDGIDNDCDGELDTVDKDCGGTGENCPDVDGDGFSPQGGSCGLLDCDDANSNVNPDPGTAEECGDGIDNDCDGAIDSVDTDCGGGGCVDADADASCIPADCDDTDPNVNPNPGTQENCQDGIDNDCDGAIDSVDTDCGGGGCVDADADASCIPADCDDTNPTVSHRTPENCQDGIDNDCDGATDAVDTDCGGGGCVDADADASCVPADCDDTDPTVSHRTPENCQDGIDNDCDGAIDSIDTDCGGPGVTPPGVEVCSNCVDDNGDGLGDLLDPSCKASSLTLKAVAVGHLRKSPAIVKRVRVKTTIPSATLLDDADSITNGLTVGLAFDDGTQLCLNLNRIKISRKNKLVLRNGIRPRGNLKIKRKPNGILKVRYKQKGRIELSNPKATAIAFGVYGPTSSYNGTAALRAKNGKKLSSVQPAE